MTTGSAIKEFAFTYLGKLHPIVALEINGRLVQGEAMSGSIASLWERPVLAKRPFQTSAVSGAASHLHHLGAIFRQQRRDQFAFLGHLFRGRLRRWRCAAFDGKSDRQEEFVLSRRRTHTEHAGGLAGHVLERVRGVGRNVDGRSRAYGVRLTAKVNSSSPSSSVKHFLKVVAVRRGPAAGGHQHVDQAIASRGLRARH
jgi:hypothetical protein